jgi:SagB-type dehydrogenase family enzyme
MSTTSDELQLIVEALSEDEREVLLDVARDITRGERFWEMDCGLFYNEFTKQRFFRVGRHLAHGPSEDRFVPIPVSKSYHDARRVPLPSPEQLDAGLGEILMRRRSRREFSGTPLSASEISTLLAHACGVTAHVPAYGYSRLPLRSFPSHGALQSPEFYLSVQAVDGVAPGIYHFHPGDHALECLHEDNHAELIRSVAFEEEYVGRASVVLAVTGCYERLRWKYGERAFRFMCLDAGFAGENVYLVGEAMGLGVCAVSGFAQDKLEELLGINGRDEIALILLAVGVIEQPTRGEA